MDENLSSSVRLSGNEVAFCRVYAESGSIAKAYRSVNDADGLSDTDCLIEGRKIFRKPAIQKEIKRIQKRLNKPKIDPIAIVNCLVDSVNRNPDDIWEKGPDGLPKVKDWDKIPKEAKRLIVGMKIEEPVIIDGMVVRGGKVDLKLTDRSADIDKLMKILKMTDEGTKIFNIQESAPQGNDALTALIYAAIIQKEQQEQIPLQIEAKEQEPV